MVALRKLLLCFITAALCTCASQRPLLPPGEIPTLEQVAAADEQYGHQVFSQLAERYELDRSDARIERVRSIVDTLTAVRGNDRHIWHVYVFKDDSFLNAAAARGNFIFVWSGLVDAVQSDEELAVVLAHEIGHVLAGHTHSDPSEQVNEILAGSAGEIAQQIMVSQGGTAGALAGIGGALAAELIKGFIVYPNKQRLEKEADQLGLYLMAEAGYDPEAAVKFWERMKEDPSFGGSPVEFLSSHPSSEERLAHLKAELPNASARFRGEKEPEQKVVQSESSTEEMKISAIAVTVRSEPARDAPEQGTLIRDDLVKVVKEEDDWIQVESIYSGWIPRRAFEAPVE